MTAAERYLTHCLPVAPTLPTFHKEKPMSKVSDTPTSNPANTVRRYEIDDSYTWQCYEDVTARRIRALVDIPAHGVKAGDLGGYVESEANLAQDSNAWIADDALVINDAKVSGDAIVSGKARVVDNAQIQDFARVCHNATVAGNAVIKEKAALFTEAIVADNACVYGNAEISGNAEIRGHARVYDYARACAYACITGSAHVYGNAFVSDYANVRGYAHVFGYAIVRGTAALSGAIRVYDSAIIEDSVEAGGYSLVFGEARLSGHANIGGNAAISSNQDYLHFGPLTGQNFWLTAHRDSKQRARIAFGKFSGDLEEFNAYLARNPPFDLLTRAHISSFTETVKQAFGL